MSNGNFLMQLAGSVLGVYIAMRTGFLGEEHVALKTDKKYSIVFCNYLIVSHTKVTTEDNIKLYDAVHVLPCRLHINKDTVDKYVRP